MHELASHGALFVAAFLAATLLPGSSEALLTALILSEAANPWTLLAAGSAGNVLGSVFNWVCGRFLAHFRDRRWFPVSARRYRQAVGWFERWGLWSLLFAWAPVVGDPLTVIAGALRVPLLPFVLLVTAGKVARYTFVVVATLWWQGA